MQKKTIAGFALLLTIAALLVFVYISFMGTEYLMEGNHLVAILLVLMGAAFLSYSIWVMCTSKASRDKRKGLPKEVASFAVAIIVLLVGSVAFTQFLYVHDHQQQLRETLFSTADEVSRIDSVYKDYAQHRVRAYNKLLKNEKYPSAKQSWLTKSLRRRLMPEEYDTICAERQRWLMALHDASVWNISTPRNLHYIVTAGQDWTEQYRQVSSIIYKGEKAEPFGSGETLFIPGEEYKQFSQPHRPDLRSLAATIVCCLLILTTYLHVRRPRSRYAGSHR
jgi:uncharacterized membrane protein YidH (DUF202 family)